MKKIYNKDFKLKFVHVGSRLQNGPQYGYQVTYIAPDGKERKLEISKQTFYSKRAARAAISKYVKTMNRILERLQTERSEET